MPEWDAQAVDHRKHKASWYEWCDRHGWSWDDPYMHRYWERKQFTVALRRMPKDHPDRWKYEIGRRYAPDAESFAMPLGILASVALPIMSIPLSVVSGLPFWLVTFPGVALAWFLYLTKRRRHLST